MAYVVSLALGSNRVPFPEKILTKSRISSQDNHSQHPPPKPYKRPQQYNRDVAEDERGRLIRNGRESVGDILDLHNVTIRDMRRTVRKGNPRNAGIRGGNLRAPPGYYYCKALGKILRKGTIAYGNYPYYYGYRSGREVGKDKRVDKMRPEWFENKHCLDIGCNEGALTLSLVTRFRPRSMLGVDIDYDLIGKAIGRLRNLKRQLMQPNLSPRIQNLSRGYEYAGQNKKTALRRLSYTRFLCANWLTTEETKRYGLITCLSVTKWIHLNWGDRGLQEFFRKVDRILGEGGMLILEPQPWKSYQSIWKKRDVAIPAVGSLRNIKFRPSEFLSWISEHTSLVLLEKLELNQTEPSHFNQNRQLLVFRKTSQAGQTPTHRPQQMAPMLDVMLASPYALDEFQDALGIPSR